MRNKGLLAIVLFITVVGAIYFFQSTIFENSELDKDREFESSENEKKRQFELMEQKKQLKHISEQNELDRQLEKEKAAAEQASKAKPQ